MVNSYGDYENIIKKRLSPRRYEHTMRVVETAKALGEKHQISVEKVTLSAILHDYAKNMSGEELLKVIKKTDYQINVTEENEPELLHGPVAAILVELELGIKDEEILEGIRYHTTGSENLSDLGKIIYIADAIEPLRIYPRVEKIREAAWRNLDESFLLSLNSTIEWLIKNNKIIHPLSIHARNNLLIKRKKIGSELIE